MLAQAFKSIYTRKIISLFLIIQLTVSFHYILGWVVSIDNVNQYEQKLDDLKINDTYVLVPQEEYIIDKINADKDTNTKLINEYKNNSNIDFATFLDEPFIIKSDDKLSEAQKKVIDDNLGMYVSNSREPVLNALFIDNDFLKLYNLPLSDGRIFSSEDFNKSEAKIRSIILGSGFKDIYKQDDIIEMKGMNQKFRVIGFLKEGFSFFKNVRNDTYSSLSELRNYDWGGIIAQTENDDSLSLYNKIQGGCIYRIKKDKDSAQVVQEVDTIANRLNISVKSFKINDLYKSLINEYMKKIKSLLFTGTFMGIFSLITLIIIFITTIEKRKREFGIRISTGSSITGLMKLLFLENFILICIAFISNILVHLYNKRNVITGKLSEMMGNNYNIYMDSMLTPITIIKLFIIILLSTLIASAFSMYKVSKMQPKDLIGGLE